jgi:cytoskeletal protein CcmA (bactofilin family)
MRQSRRKRAKKVDSFIGRQSELTGDMRFSGGLYVDGKVIGNVLAEDDASAFLALSEHGTIEGEVNVPNVQLNGTVVGDVRAASHIELATNARVTGDVYYRLLEMAMGAEVNGKLVHIESDVEPSLSLHHEPRIEPPSLDAPD